MLTDVADSQLVPCVPAPWEFSEHGRSSIQSMYFSIFCIYCTFSMNWQPNVSR